MTALAPALIALQSMKEGPDVASASAGDGRIGGGRGYNAAALERGYSAHSDHCGVGCRHLGKVRLGRRLDSGNDSNDPVFLAIPAITSVVREAAGRLMEWREINLRSGTLDGLAPMDTGHRPMTPPRRFPPPWRLVEMPGGYAVEDATGQQLGVFYGSGAARTLRAGSGPHHGRGAAHGGEFRATSGTAERCQRGRVISSLYACMSRCL